MIRTIYALALLLLVGQVVLAQTSPCLRLSTDAGACDNPPSSLSSAIQAVNFTHKSKTAGLSANPEARYKAFWIFGDGNFMFYPDRSKALDESTLDQNYVYHRGGKYNVRSVLVEKKSNKQPPDKELISVDVELSSSKGAAGPTLPGTSFTTQLADNNRAAVFNHEKVRLGGYETALVVSSYLPASSAQPVALVCYNSYRGNSRQPFSGGQLFARSNVEVEKANYTSNDFPHQIGATTNLDGILGSALSSSGYGNVIMQPVRVNSDLIAPSFNEFRCFPIFRTEPRNASGLLTSTGIPDLDTTGMGETQFLVLILEGATVNPQYNSQSLESQLLFGNGPVTNQPFISPITAAERQRILSLLQTHCPALYQVVDTTTLALPNGMYIRGASHRVVSIVSSIDPTMLEVKSICAAENGLYDVAMKMTICNEGNAEEPHISVRIDNLAGIQIIEPKFDSTGLDSFLYQPRVMPTWKFAYLQGLAGAYNDAGVYASSCISRDFSFKTDWNGAQKLAVKGSLKATVTFHTALIKPTQEFPNVMDDATLLSKENGYNCQPDGKGNYWWLWLLLFLLGLIIWWYRKMNQEDSGSN